MVAASFNNECLWLVNHSEKNILVVTKIIKIFLLECFQYSVNTTHAIAMIHVLSFCALNPSTYKGLASKQWRDCTLVLFIILMVP